MNDCARIEKLLWNYSEIDPEDKAAVGAHLEQCPRCRQAHETIRALKASSESDRRKLAGIDPEAFDLNVMARIHRRPGQLVLQESSSRQYDIRMAFSFVAAAAVVLLILKSVSDLGPADMQRATSPMLSQEEGRRIINIQLGREAEAPMAMKSAPSPSEEKGIDAFSILTGPVTAPSPESVNIDAVYVASDSVPIENQREAASLAEVYSDTGAVQAPAPQVSVLITTEKMPKPIHVVVPEYPIWAKKQALSANVWVKAKVNADGTVGETIILSCDNPGVGFEESAMRAAVKSQFLPASSNGINFAVWVIYPVRFIFGEQN